MKLKELLSDIEVEYICGDREIEIDGVDSNFYTVQKNDLFVYNCNEISEKLDVAERAIKHGAIAIISNEKPKTDLLSGITFVKIPRIDRLAVQLTQKFYGRFLEQMTIIGVTGTKGKTTTSHMISAMLKEAGYKTALQTTIGTDTGKNFYPYEEINPHQMKLYREMVENKVQFLIAEVSSYSSKMGFADNYPFDICVYTNLFEDHVGGREHPTFEDYAASKAHLFSLCKRAVINGDDNQIINDVKKQCGKIETFGMTKSCNLFAEKIEQTKNFKVRFKTSGSIALEVEMQYSGTFSVYNAMAAMLVCHHYGVKNETMREALSKISVKGRLEEVPFKEGIHVFVDYAHNGTSLENVLSMLKSYKPKRLICLFGCGGERSVKRRIDMGRISGELSDLTIITTDNPRSEDPIKIIKDIEDSIKKTNGKYIVIQDRTKAIEYALDIAEQEDIILLAGKGHEEYQKIDVEQIKTNDRQVVENYLCKQKEQSEL